MRATGRQRPESLVGHSPHGDGLVVLISPPIAVAVHTRKITIAPYDPARLSPNAYNWRLGSTPRVGDGDLDTAAPPRSPNRPSRPTAWSCSRGCSIWRSPTSGPTRRRSRRYSTTAAPSKPSAAGCTSLHRSATRTTRSAGPRRSAPSRRSASTRAGVVALAGYYGVVRVAEARWPWLGVLLGAPAAPKYEAPPG